MNERGRELRRDLAVIFIVMAVSLFRPSELLGISTFTKTVLANIKPFVYIGLFLVWSAMVKRSIINKYLRDYLLAVAYSGVFWVLIRTIKFEMTIRGDRLNFFLQYVYYIPVILIPTFTLFSALHTRRGENYRIPKALLIPVLCISITLILLVLTNDGHHFFYGLKNGVFSVWEYSYGIVYYIILIWITLLITIAIFLILIRAKLPNRKFTVVKPFIIITVIVIYFLLERIFPRIWEYFSSDWASFTSLAFIAILDSCITTGMIPANTDYEKLFRALNLEMIIADDMGKPCFVTAGVYAPYIIPSYAESDISEHNTILKTYRLNPGMAVWKEDTSKVTKLIKRLQDNRNELSSKNELDRENVNTKLAIQKAQENNRLFDLSQQATKKQNEALDDLLEAYSKEKEKEKKKALLAKAAVLGAFIKRRGNLVFAAEKYGNISSGELKLCFHESIRNIELTGADCFLDFHLTEDKRIGMSTACLLYEIFETAVENCIDDFGSVFVRINEEEKRLSAFISIGTNRRLKEGSLPFYVLADSDNGSLNISFSLPTEGGEEL